MNRFSKAILIFLFIFFLIEVLMLVPKEVNSDSKMTIEQFDLEEKRNDQYMRGIHVVTARGDFKEWELWAEKAVSDEEDGIWHLSQVKVDFFSENGSYFNVIGSSGEFHIKKKDMSIYGDVKIRSSNDYLLVTERVNYSSQDRVIVGPTEVNVIGPKRKNEGVLKLRGDHLRVHLDESMMQIIDNVHGNKKLSSGSVVNVTSHLAEMSGASNYVSFQGNTKFDLDEMRLSGTKAIFKYDEEESFLKSLLVSGGVKVSDIDKLATASELEVFFREDKYIFRGGPKVIQGADELIGDEIVFLKGGKQVQIKKARVKVQEGGSEKIR